MSVLIRKMIAEDKEEVLQMMRVFYDSPAVFFKAKDHILEKDIEDCIGDCPWIDGYIFEENESIIGYAMVAMCYATEFGGLCLWLEDLYLKPEFRGLKIGSNFLHYLEEAYPDAVRIKLEVETENETAIATYKKAGYGVSPYFVMTKELDGQR
ncbi:MAG: GNAT family N-acetyltransferase [Eubacteriales bacterium]|nr:GNAT family N-acetyltransferase [Eubacteriales bacterium]